MLALCAANAAYLAGMDAAMPAGEACLVAGAGAPLAAMLRRGGVVATTLDEHPDILRAVGDAPLSSGVVLGAAPVVDLLDERGCDAVLPFKTGARLWEMAEFQGLRVLASGHRLTRQLENKLALQDIARGADARIPDTATVRLDDDLARVARDGGIALPRVFQPAVGFAGAGTVLLRTAQDVENLVAYPPGGVAVGKLVEYVDGEPVTVNGAVIPAGVHGAPDDAPVVLVGMVARQLTGLPALTPTDFGSCGNDWAQPPARPRVAALRAMAARVGEELAQRGFVGAFGIDAMLPADGGVPVLIEVNPRWTASLALQVELQSVAGLPTLLDAHLAAFAYHPEQRPSLAALVDAYGEHEDAACTRGGIAASTVIAYNATGRDVMIAPDVEPGVWRRALDDDGAVRIERVRDGWRFADLEQDDEFLLLPHGPVRPVAHGAYLARVVMRGPAAADPQARTLRDDVRALMDCVVARVERTA